MSPGAPLYDITGRLRALYDLVEDVAVGSSDGTIDLDDEIRQAIDCVEGEFEDKIRSCIYLLIQWESEVSAVEEEIARLKKRAQVKSNGIDRMKDRIRLCMEAAESRELDLGIRKVGIRMCPPKARITDPEAVPDKYKQTETSIMKKPLLDDLKSGKDVPGAELGQDESLQIY